MPVCPGENRTQHSDFGEAAMVNKETPAPFKRAQVRFQQLTEAIAAGRAASIPQCSPHEYALKSEVQTGVKEWGYVLIRLQEVERITGLSRSGIYLLMEQDAFPKQIILGAKTVAWVQAEVQVWIAERIAASRTVTEAPTSTAAPKPASTKNKPGIPKGGAA